MGLNLFLPLIILFYSLTIKVLFQLSLHKWLKWVHKIPLGITPGCKIWSDRVWNRVPEK